MKTFLTDVKNKAPIESSPDKTAQLATAAGTEKKNASPEKMTVVKIRSHANDKIEDEVVQREERILRCIETAVIPVIKGR